MKKFVFTNEKFYGIKEKEFERLKLDMGNVDKEIDTATAALAELEDRFSAERAAFAAACKEGVGAGELMNYQGFFEFLKEQQAEVRSRLAQLVRRKQALADALAKVNNELKVLDEMREEQYQEYCKEVAAEESKELETTMSFSIYEKAV